MFCSEQICLCLCFTFHNFKWPVSVFNMKTHASWLNPHEHIDFLDCCLITECFGFVQVCMGRFPKYQQATNFLILVLKKVTDVTVVVLRCLFTLDDDDDDAEDSDMCMCMIYKTNTLIYFSPSKCWTNQICVKIRQKIQFVSCNPQKRKIHYILQMCFFSRDLFYVLQ